MLGFYALSEMPIGALGPSIPDPGGEPTVPLILEDGSCVDNANALIDRIMMNDHFATRPDNTVYYALNEVDRDNLAIEATRMFTYLTRVVCGTLMCTNHDLPFPREGYIDINGREVANDVVPNDVKVSIMELAFLMIGNKPKTAVNVTSGQKYKSVSLGKGALKVDYNSDNLATFVSKIPAFWWGTLSDCIEPSSAVTGFDSEVSGVSVLRGN